MKRRQIADFALRLVIAYAAMVFLAGFLGTWYGEMLLPVYRMVVRWICADYRVMGFDLIDARGELRFGLVAVSTHFQTVGGNIVPPGAMVTTATLLGHSLQHPVVIFSLLLAWPGIEAWRRVGLGIAALPVLLVVECADVPVVLGGNVRAAVLEQFAPQLVNSSVMVQWIDFLGGGGRIVISLLAAAAALCVFRSVEAVLGRGWRPSGPYVLARDPR